MDVKSSVIARLVRPAEKGLKFGAEVTSLALMEVGAPLRLDPLTLAFAREDNGGTGQGDGL